MTAGPRGRREGELCGLGVQQREQVQGLGWEPGWPLGRTLQTPRKQVANAPQAPRSHGRSPQWFLQIINNMSARVLLH